jgi:hypothetical protein
MKRSPSPLLAAHVQFNLGFYTYTKVEMELHNVPDPETDE